MAKVAAIIAAAGASKRFGGKEKKQFAKLDGRAVFLRSVEVFSNHKDVCQTILAISPEDQERFNIKFKAHVSFAGVQVVLGGKHRWQSVKNCLQKLSDEAELVAIHDAARPGITAAILDRLIAAAEKHGAAIVAAPVPDTVKRIDPKEGKILQSLDRSDLYLAQTPQVFRRELIVQAYQSYDPAKDGPVTDDAQLLERQGRKIAIIKGSTALMKITTIEDLQAVEAIIKKRPEPKRKGPLGPWAGEAGW